MIAHIFVAYSEKLNFKEQFEIPQSTGSYVVGCCSLQSSPSGVSQISIFAQNA